MNVLSLFDGMSCDGWTIAVIKHIFKNMEIK